MFRSLVLVACAAALSELSPPKAASAAPPAETRLRAAPDDLPRVEPALVEMSRERLAVIDRVVRNAMVYSGFPGAAVIVGRHGAVVWERGYGTLGTYSDSSVDPRRTLYDLASLTKVVATSAAAMVLVDQRRLRLDDPVGRYLPEFRKGSKSEVTIRQLLTHSSGLPVGVQLADRSPAAARRLVLEAPLVAEPGERTAYSDVGAAVLGFVIERVTGMPLDRFVKRAIYTPLGMRNTTFRPSPKLAPWIAETEGGILPAGVVHDPNARALGGVAGHAGLFGTASDLAIFAQFMLERGRFQGKRLVGDSTVSLFTRRAVGRQALGWETCVGGGSCGRLLAPTAFGHTGFTGTSMWIDPERDLFVIVLTNWIAGSPERGVAPVAVLHDVRSDIADVAALAVIDGQTQAMPERLRSDLRIGW